MVRGMVHSMRPRATRTAKKPSSRKRRMEETPQRQYRRSACIFSNHHCRGKRDGGRTKLVRRRLCFGLGGRAVAGGFALGSFGVDHGFPEGGFGPGVLEVPGVSGEVMLLLVRDVGQAA